VEKTQEGAIHAACHDDQKNNFPKGETNTGYRHRAPPE
jgi:hypothetical protein